MSGNKVSPSPSAEGQMESHPMHLMESETKSPPPPPSYSVLSADDHVKSGDTKVHDNAEPVWDEAKDDNNQAGQKETGNEDFSLPGSVTHSRESLDLSKTSGSYSRQSGTHSRQSGTHSKDSVQHSRESIQQQEAVQTQGYGTLPESPDHNLPPMPDDDDVLSENEPPDYRNVYTPALPRETSNIEHARYKSPSPPPYENSATGSQAELLPSEKKVPLSPIGNNRVGPSNEHPAPVYPGGSSDYPTTTRTRRLSELSERALIHEDIRASDNTDGAGCCGWLLYIFSILLIGVTLPFSLMFTIKVVQEYERAVIFRLGRLPSGGAKGPGIFFIIPCIESYSKVDLRTVSFDVPPQEVLTKDSVTVSVDAVVYYRVSNPTVSVANVENAHHSTRLLAQTTLRNILGTKDMSEILSDREAISHGMQSSLDEATDRWGIKVERVEIKDVRLPVQLQRAMAAEAEAAREARAKVIAAEGEQKASKALKEAADVMCQSSAALQLRYLQTLNSISAEKNSTIIFPLPVDMISSFLKR